MPAQFTLPPDTRAVGTGNPPADMNGVVDTLTAMGAVLNVLNVTYSGGADPTGVADSTAAFQACMTAAIATGAEMVIPAGTYNLHTAGLHITGPLKMRGLGAALSNQNGFFLTAAVTLNCDGGGAGTNSMFDFPFQGYLWGGLEISGLVINYTGTNDVFHNMNLTDFVFRDMAISLTAGGSSAFTSSGTASVLNGLWERVNISTYANVRTVPMTSIVSSNTGAISNCTHFKCKFSNLGFDRTQPMVLFSCTFAGNGFHYADNLRECWFEHPYGGAYKSLSGMGITVDGCSIWDAFTGNGASTTVAAGSNGGTISGIAAWANPSAGVLAVAASPTSLGFPPSGTLNVTTSGTLGVITYTGVSGSTFTGCAFVSGSGTVSTGAAVVFPVSTAKSFYYFGAAPSNSGSTGTKITGCSRNQGGPDGSTCWDVEFESTSSQSVIEGYCVKPGTASTYTPAYFNFNGHNDIQLIGNQSPQGAAVNGNSNTVVSNPSYSTTVLGSGAAPGAVALELASAVGWSPLDSGFLAWNFDPAILTGTGNALATGAVTLIRVNLRRAVTVTNVCLYVTTLGATLTSSQNLAGLYNSSGTLIAATADQTTTWNTGGSTGLKQIPLTGGPYPLQAGFYWVAAVSNGTTPVSLLRAQNTASTFTNIGVSAAADRWATNGTATTSLPSITPSANSGDGHAWWAALS